MKELMLKGIKRKLTGYDREAGLRLDIDYSDYHGHVADNQRMKLGEFMVEYPEDLFKFFETLCSFLPDDVTLDEFLLNMELLVDDFEEGRCGFRNNSGTEKRFNELNTKFKMNGSLPVVLSFVPRYIDEVADREFANEFWKRFREEILGETEMELPKKEYGYIEVEENRIDISNKDKAEVLAGLYNNSQPAGNGMAHYDSTKMTVEVARAILEQTQVFGYLKGRPLKINLSENIVGVAGYNGNNRKGLAQIVISNCRNINDIGKDRLKMVAVQEKEEEKEKVKKQIEEAISAKQAELSSRQEGEESMAPSRTRSEGLAHLRVEASDLSPLRRLIEETGYEITEDTIEFIKGIENEAYPEAMKTMQEVEDASDLSDVYEYYVEEITVARNRDWYIIYGDDEDSVQILDIASSPDRDVEASRREMHNYLIRVINAKAVSERKPVILSAREDTSYKMIQRMVKAGEYKIVRDEVTTWETDDSIVMHDLMLAPIMQREKDK